MRLIVHFIGLIILALGFIGVVIDGTRSMANATLWFTRVNEVCDALFPAALAKLQAAVISHAPAWLWDQVCVAFLQMPASIVALVLGLALVKFSEKKHDYSGLEGIAPLR